MNTFVFNVTKKYDLSASFSITVHCNTIHSAKRTANRLADEVFDNGSLHFVNIVSMDITS